MKYIPVCPVCDGEGLLTSGKYVFPHRVDLHKLWFYECKEHDARVGCHTTSKNPMSHVMATAELRMLRQKAHKLFDPLWKNNTFESRNGAYEWLAEELDIPTLSCHISHFREPQCYKAIAVLENYFNAIELEKHEESLKVKWQSKTSLFRKNNET
jgi:hypothetical protein